MEVAVFSESWYISLTQTIHTLISFPQEVIITHQALMKTLACMLCRGAPQIAFPRLCLLSTERRADGGGARGRVRRRGVKTQRDLGTQIPPTTFAHPPLTVRMEHETSYLQAVKPLHGGSGVLLPVLRYARYA